MNVLNLAAWSVIAMLLIADICVHLWEIKLARVIRKALALTEIAVASIKAAESADSGEAKQ